MTPEQVRRLLGWRNYGGGWRRHYSQRWCNLMNVLDFTIWGCEGCHWASPYGRVIMAGCPKHDA